MFEFFKTKFVSSKYGRGIHRIQGYAAFVSKISPAYTEIPAKIAQVFAAFSGIFLSENFWEKLQHGIEFSLSASELAIIYCLYFQGDDCEVETFLCKLRGVLALSFDGVLGFNWPTSELLHGLSSPSANQQLTQLLQVLQQVLTQMPAHSTIPQMDHLSP